MMAVLGAVAAGALAAVLYLGAPQQRWRREPLRGRTCAMMALLLAATAIGSFRRMLGSAEAVYVTLLVVMIVLVALPFLTAALAGRQEPS